MRRPLARFEGHLGSLGTSVSVGYGVVPMGGWRTATCIAGALALGGIAAGCGSSSSPQSSSETTAAHSRPSATFGPLNYPARYAHFSADFPAAPKETSTPASFGSYKMNIQLAGAQSPDGPVEAAEEDIDPALPPDQVQVALVSALRGVTVSSGLSITAQPAVTSYRSFDAYAATYSFGARTLGGISFVTGNHARLYILLAPTDLLQDLESSVKLTG